MTFGKDDSRLNGQVGSWRTAAHQATTRAPRSSGGLPNFIGKFVPSEIITQPDTVRLLAGKYIARKIIEEKLVEIEVPFKPYVEHFDGRLKKSTICSAGPWWFDKSKAEPCVGCQIYRSDVTIDGKGQKQHRVSRREMYAWNMIHLSPYVKIPQTDEKGLVKTNPNTGEAYMIWAPLRAHERTKYANNEMSNGRLLHYPQGYSHYKTLEEYDSVIGKSCRHCNSRDSIASIAWTCAKCGEAVIEMDNHSYDPETLKKLTIEPVVCPYCTHQANLSEIFECSACGEGDRATLFDVNIDIARMAGREGTNQTVLQVTGWSNPHPLEEQYSELLKNMWDLDQLYGPTPLEEQEEKFGTKWAGNKNASGANVVAPPPARQPVSASQFSKPR